MAKKIRDPRLRISRRIKKDQVFKVKVKFDHPSFTGLGIVDAETKPVFSRAIPVSFIRNMFVYYGEQLVSRFRMSSAIAELVIVFFRALVIVCLKYWKLSPEYFLRCPSAL